jgi:hypothetical protein
MLKGDHGLAHGVAHRVTLLARGRAEPGAPELPADPVAALHVGGRASLRPLHDAIMREIRTLGPVEITPKKGYLRLRGVRLMRVTDPANSHVALPSTKGRSLQLVGRQQAPQAAHSGPDRLSF